jgi:hypothetical protein
VPNRCTSTPCWCSQGWLLTARRARPLPSPADRRAVGLDAVLDVVLGADLDVVLGADLDVVLGADLDVVLDVLGDRAPDLADGRVPVPDCRGGMVVPLPR